jgi:HEAT repeat protein
MDDNLRKLYNAIEAKDAEQVDIALDKCFGSNFSREYIPALIELLGKTWHYRHEDIVSVLQQLKDSRAVDALYEETHSEYEYLNYDDCYGLARKCTWALADIGTPEAKAKLQQLAQESNQLVAEYAQKRLNNWEEEKSRKGHA